MTLAVPKARRWTREEYYQMADLGWFRGQRVELIHGEIIEMAPQMNRHAVALELAARALRKSFGDQYWIRTQLPLALLPDSEPEPDVAVVAGDPRRCDRHPAGALLVVEISDTTLRYDATRKAALYAQAAIPEYWIVNLLDGQLCVHRGPSPDPTDPDVHRYTDVRILGPNDTVSPLAQPEAQIRVAEMLP